MDTAKGLEVEDSRSASLTAAVRANAASVEHDAPAPNAAISDAGDERLLVQRSGYTLAARLAMAGSRGLGLILISRALGAAAFGEYSLVVTSYAIASGLGTLGLDQAHVHAAGRGRQATTSLLCNALWATLVLGVAAAALLLGSVSLLKGSIFDGTPMRAILVTAAVLPAILHQNALSGIVIGRGWFRYHGISESVKWLMHIGIIAGFTISSKLTIESAVAALYLPIVLTGMGHFIALSYADRISPMNILLRRPELAGLREVASFGTKACAINVSHVLHMRLDVYLIKYFSSSSVLGRYALIVNITDVLLYLGRSVGLVLFAQRSARPTSSSSTTPRLARLVMGLAGVVSIAILVFGDSLIALLFGPQFSGCTSALLCRIPGLLAESASFVLVGDLLGKSENAVDSDRESHGGRRGGHLERHLRAAGRHRGRCLRFFHYQLAATSISHASSRAHDRNAWIHVPTSKVVGSGDAAKNEAGPESRRSRAGAGLEREGSEMSALQNRWRNLLWLLEACVVLYFAIGKSTFEPRLALGDVSLNMLLQLVVLGCLIAIPWTARAARLSSTGFCLVAGFTLLLWCGTWQAQNEAYRWVKPLGYAVVVLPCMALLVAHIRDELHVRRILWIWCALGAVMMAGGIIMLAAGAAPARLAVVGGGSNVYARTVAASLLILIGLGSWPRATLARIAAGLALGGFGIVLVCAGSKTALFGFGIALAILGWRLHRRRLMLVAMVVTTIFAISPTLVHRFVTNADKDRGSVRLFRLPDVEDPKGSYGTRLQFYAASVGILEEHGLMGVGTGDWGVPLHLPSGRRYPHNMGLELGCELGLLGLGFLAAMLWLGWRWSRAPRGKGDERLLASLTALFVFWMFNAQLSGDLIDNRNVWWPLLLLEVVWLRRNENLRLTSPALPGIQTSRLTVGNPA